MHVLLLVLNQLPPSTCLPNLKSAISSLCFSSSMAIATASALRNPLPPTAKNMKKREKRCRNNIATFLALMGFHDDDPDTTVDIMLGKLHEIKENSTAMIDYGETDQSIEEKRLKIHQKHDLSIKAKRLKIVKKKNDGDRNAAMDMKLPTELNNFINSIGGSEAEFVIEKRLTITDVTSNQGRLLIPELQVQNSEFLTGDEKRKLGQKEDIKVWVFDPQFRKATLNLAQWKMKNENYVLKTNWNHVVRINGLEENMVMQVWSFRVDQQQLCFALVRIEDES